MVRAALALALMVATGAAAAQSRDAQAIAEGAKPILSQPAAHADPGIATQSEALERAAQQQYAQDIQAIFADSKRAVQDQMAANIASNPDQNPNRLPPGTLRYRIFISQSMPVEEIRALAKLSASRQDTALLVRGTKPGQTLGQLQRWLMQLLAPTIKQNGPAPEFQVDPQAFRDLKVAQVPVMARYDADDKLLVRVAGVTNPDYLENELKLGHKGDLGVAGPTVGVAEGDMIEQLQASAAKVDFDAMKARAVGRYFAELPTLDLPQATVTQRRLVDPTFTVAETIAMPDGQVIATKGQRVNPLDRVPFSQRLIVIDPLQEGQVELAKRWLAGSTGRVKVLVTRFDRATGFAGYDGLMVALGVPVYLLSPQLQRTFQLQKTPSIVTAVGNRFAIDEIDPTHPPKGFDHAPAVTPSR